MRPPRHNSENNIIREIKRNNEKSKRYGSDWRKLRHAFLQKYPLCDICKKNDLIVAANVVHHIVDVVNDPSRRLDWDNLQSLCKQCHDKITAKSTHEKRGI